MKSYGRVDPQTQDLNEITTKKSRKRCILITTASVILLFTVIFLAVGLSIKASKKKNGESNNGESANLSTGSKAIQVACNSTLYPEVCVEELTNYPGGLTASPRQLVSIAVKVAIDHALDAYYMAKNLSINSGNHTEDYAILDCTELMDQAIDNLNLSITQLANLSLSELTTELNEVKVWLSSAGSYEEACTNGFLDILSPTLTNRSEVMRDKEKKLFQAIAIAMDLVASLADLGADLSSWKDSLPKLPFRRLLSTTDSRADHSDSDSYSDAGERLRSFPDWVSTSDRRLLQSTQVVADAIVGQDSGSQYKKIQDAVDAVPKTLPNGKKRWVIYIKAGTYSEQVTLSKSKTQITFIGDGMGKTVITGDKNVALQGYTTFSSATVALSGNGFIAKGVTFRNTAGPKGHQAVALRAGADFLIFDSCSFEGYQDTLYALSSRQFYWNCDIYGTVDYIFGNAIAVFQSCRLLARLPAKGQQNTYTAHGRQISSDPSGYSFQKCSLVATPELTSATFTVLTYLGRPWKDYSRAVFISSYMDKLIDPAGWLAWNASNPFINTLYYGEYRNTGPGSAVSARVKWPGVHSTMSTSEASIFALTNFFGSLSWLTDSGVTYSANLPA